MSDRAPDSVSMLEVIGEARAAAASQQEAALKMLASAALQAFVDGVDIRVIANRCGFELDAPPVVIGGGFFSMPWGPREVSQVERFASWLGNSVQALAMERLGENGVEIEEVPRG